MSGPKPSRIVYTLTELLDLEGHGAIPEGCTLPEQSFYRFDATVVMKMNNYFHSLHNHSQNGGHASNRRGKRDLNHRHPNHNTSHTDPVENEDDETPAWMEETDFKVDQDFKLYTRYGTHTTDDFEREKQMFRSKLPGNKSRNRNQERETGRVSSAGSAGQAVHSGETPVDEKAETEERAKNTSPDDRGAQQLELELKKQLEEPEILGPTEQEYYELLEKQKAERKKAKEAEEAEESKKNLGKQNMAFGDLQFAMEMDTRKQLDTNFFNSLMNRNSNTHAKVSENSANITERNNATYSLQSSSHSHSNLNSMPSSASSSSQSSAVSRPSLLSRTGSQILPRELTSNNPELNESLLPKSNANMSPMVSQSSQLPPQAHLPQAQQIQNMHNSQQLQRMKQLQLQQEQHIHEMQRIQAMQMSNQKQHGIDPPDASLLQNMRNNANLNNMNIQLNMPQGVSQQSNSTVPLAMPQNMPNMPQNVQINANQLPPHMLQQLAGRNFQLPPGLNVNMHSMMPPGLIHGVNPNGNGQMPSGFPPNRLPPGLMMPPGTPLGIPTQNPPAPPLTSVPPGLPVLPPGMPQPPTMIDGVRRDINADINMGMNARFQENGLNPANSQQHTPLTPSQYASTKQADPVVQQQPRMQGINLPPPDQLPPPFREKFFQIQKSLLHFQQNGQAPPPALVDDMMKFHQVLEANFGSRSTG